MYTGGNRRWVPLRCSQCQNNIPGKQVGMSLEARQHYFADSPVKPWVTWLLKRREIWLEPNRGDMASRWFQTEVVKFIALLFPFWSKLKIWSFSCHSCCTEVARKFTTESDAHGEMYFLFIKPIILHSTW